MDEPFASLDAQMREMLQEELLIIPKRTGKTILFITHNVDEAIFLGTKVIVMTASPGSIKAELSANVSSSSADREALKQKIGRSSEEVLVARRPMSRSPRKSTSRIMAVSLTTGFLIIVLWEVSVRLGEI